MVPVLWSTVGVMLSQRGSNLELETTFDPKVSGKELSTQILALSRFACIPNSDQVNAICLKCSVLCRRG